MRSFKLLVYKHDEKEELEEIAMDINLNPVFLTAVEMVDDETYLGADGRHIFLCQKNRYFFCSYPALRHRACLTGGYATIFWDFISTITSLCYPLST